MCFFVSHCFSVCFCLYPVNFVDFSVLLFFKFPFCHVFDVVSLFFR